jgi:hypothetical protein
MILGEILGLEHYIYISRSHPLKSKWYMKNISNSLYTV